MVGLFGMFGIVCLAWLLRATLLLSIKIGKALRNDLEAVRKEDQTPCCLVVMQDQIPMCYTFDTYSSPCFYVLILSSDLLLTIDESLALACHGPIIRYRS